VWGWNPAGRDCGGPHSLANRYARTCFIARCHTLCRFHRHSQIQPYVRGSSLGGSDSNAFAYPNASSYRHAHPGSNVRANPHSFPNSHAGPYPDASPSASSNRSAHAHSHCPCYPTAYSNGHADTRSQAHANPRADVYADSLAHCRRGRTHH
jgi:hypothetical protein